MAHRIVLEQWLADLFNRFDARRSFDSHGEGGCAEACRLATLPAQTPDFRRQHGEHPMNEQEQSEWPYWKAAISCLPSQEMRDAAWEFFVRHLAQNPKMADTFIGVILVMQANGLYMLKVPKLVHDEAFVPLGTEVSRLRGEMAETVSRHAEVTKDSFAVCEKTRQVAEAAATAAKELDDAIRDGWREVNTEKLAGRIQEEVETALLRPLVAQCRQVEEMTPALRDAADQLKESACKLRAFHFKGILVVMLTACLVVMGGCFSFGWWKLSRYYERMVDAALKRILLGNAGNQEAFTRLTEMNVPYPRVTRH
jgi:hypothetical protein